MPSGARITQTLVGAPATLKGVLGGAGGRYITDELAPGRQRHHAGHRTRRDSCRAVCARTAPGMPGRVRHCFTRMLPVLNIQAVFRLVDDQGHAAHAGTSSDTPASAPPVPRSTRWTTRTSMPSWTMLAEVPHRPRLDPTGERISAWRSSNSTGIPKTFGRRSKSARDRPRGPQRRVLRLCRPVGLRQVHAVAAGCGPRGGDRRQDRHRRARRDRRPARPARHRHGVPVVCAVSAHGRLREHGLRPEARALPEGRDRGARAAGRADAAHRESADAPSPRPFGRPAPARGDRPRHRARAARLPVRRTAVQPRCRVAGRDARRAGQDQAAAPAHADHHRSTSRTTRSRR